MSECRGLFISRYQHEESAQRAESMVPSHRSPDSMGASHTSRILTRRMTATYTPIVSDTKILEAANDT